MKVNRFETRGLDGAERVTYRLGDLDVIASALGVTLRGELAFEEQTDTTPFAKAIGDAFKEVKRLRGKIRSSILANEAGH